MSKLGAVYINGYFAIAAQFNEVPLGIFEGAVTIGDGHYDVSTYISDIKQVDTDDIEDMTFTLSNKSGGCRISMRGSEMYSMDIFPEGKYPVTLRFADEKCRVSYTWFERLSIWFKHTFRL